MCFGVRFSYSIAFPKYVRGNVVQVKDQMVCMVQQYEYNLLTIDRLKFLLHIFDYNYVLYIATVQWDRNGDWWGFRSPLLLSP